MPRKENQTGITDLDRSTYRKISFGQEDERTDPVSQALYGLPPDPTGLTGSAVSKVSVNKR